MDNLEDLAAENRALAGSLKVFQRKFKEERLRADIAQSEVLRLEQENHVLKQDLNSWRILSVTGWIIVLFAVAILQGYVI